MAEILFVDFVGFEKTVKVMAYAKGAAKLLDEPIAVAITKLEEKIEPANVNKVKEFKNFGIAGEIDGEKVVLANDKVMEELNIPLHGDTANKVFFAINGQIQAVFKIK